MFLYGCSTTIAETNTSINDKPRNIQKEDFEAIMAQSQKTGIQADAASRKADKAVEKKVDVTINKIETLKEEIKDLVKENETLQKTINVSGEPFVIITEKQANDINNIFKNIKNDRVKFDSLVVSFDKAKKLNKELDAKQANYYSLLVESNNRTSVIEEKNKNLLLINTSLGKAKLSIDLSTISLMFALVSILAISLKP